MGLWWWQPTEAAALLAGGAEATATPATVAAVGAVSAPTVLASAKTLTEPPANLAGTPISSTRIDLSWDALVGAASYDIERDGAVIVAGHVGLTYSDTGLDADTQ